MTTRSGVWQKVIDTGDHCHRSGICVRWLGQCVDGLPDAPEAATTRAVVVHSDVCAEDRRPRDGVTIGTR
jgi:predicted alpha-1,6-mannanase (GH76 family)